MTEETLPTPLNSRVLVLPCEVEESKGGIIIPEVAQEKQLEGTVCGLGTGGVTPKGMKIPFHVAIGDKVIIHKYGGTELVVNNKTYYVVREEDIIAIVG